MSESIEVATPAAVAGPVLGERAAVRPVSAAALVRLIQGLYFVFWGLLVTVLVSAESVLLAWQSSFAEVVLAGGVAITVAGTWRLRQAGFAEHASWRRRTGRLRGLALLLAYFALLFCLWRRAPVNLYLQLNAVGFVATGIALLMMVNRTVTALAAVVGRPQLALESRLFTAANIALLLLPFLAALSYLTVMVVARQTSPLDEFRHLLQRVSLLVGMIVLLPVALTLALVWAAKDSLLEELLSRDQRPAVVSALP